MSYTVNLLPILSWLSRRGDVARVPGTKLWLVNDPAVARALLQSDGEHGGVKKGAGNDALQPLIGHGVFFAEGADWRAKRVAALSALNKHELSTHARLMHARVEEMFDRWQAAPGGHVDLYAELRWTLVALFGDALLGSRAFDDADNRALLDEAWSEAVRRVFSLTGKLPSRRGARAIERLRALVGAAAITAVQEAGAAQAKHSALHVLARATTAADDGGPAHEARAVHTPSTLTDEGITLALAGQECAALSIAWTLALLGDERNRDALAHVAREIDDVLGERAPTPEDAAQLPRTRAAFHEALRLYPPAWILSRETTRPFTHGAVQLPAGSTVLISPLLLHRSPRSFDDALAFKPERFERGLDARAREAYMPFSAGPRACIGVGLATTLAMLIIPRALQRFALRTDALPDVAPTITLRPARPLMVTASVRPRRGERGGTEQRNADDALRAQEGAR